MLDITRYIGNDEAQKIKRQVRNITPQTIKAEIMLQPNSKKEQGKHVKDQVHPVGM